MAIKKICDICGKETEINHRRQNLFLKTKHGLEITIVVADEIDSDNVTCSDCILNEIIDVRQFKKEMSTITHPDYPKDDVPF